MKANERSSIRGLDKLGSCPDCIILSVFLFIMSLLVLTVGEVNSFSIMVAIGWLGSLCFGLLVGLHIVFFFLKRKKVVIEKPRGGCCGG